MKEMTIKSKGNDSVFPSSIISQSGMSETKSYSKARELIDELHKEDPVYISKQAKPLTEEPEEQDELQYADHVERWTVKLLSSSKDKDRVDPSLLPEGINLDLVLLASRCQHLARFKNPRSDYKEGKIGYLKWRRELYEIQADRAKEILLKSDVSRQEAELVWKWVSKKELNVGKEGGEWGTQLLEDAAVLVFLETQLHTFAVQHSSYPREKFIDILRKTWKKLSKRGQEAAIDLAGQMQNGEIKQIVLDAVKDETGFESEDQGKESSMSETLPVASENQKSSRNSQPKISSSVRPVTIESSTARLASIPGRGLEADGWEEATSKEVEAENQNVQESSQVGTSTTVTKRDSKDERVFGGRLLRDEEDVWEHNAWDHVTPPASYLATVEEKLAKQRETRLTKEQQARFHADPASFWDQFYAQHDHRFFKDRRWLHIEFAELVQSTLEGAPPTTIVEVGCGAGNTVFPLLEMNKNPNLVIHACDYSAEAVGVVKNNPLCSNPPTGQCHASVWDLSSSSTSSASSAPPQDFERAFSVPSTLTAGTADFVVLIFVLSALHPEEWKAAVRNVKAMLKPGGTVLLRDYGWGDLPMMRFGKGKQCEDGFYVRGDGTRVYFFSPEELTKMFDAGPPPSSASPRSVALSIDDADRNGLHSFETVQLAVDRRLLVNRKEQKKMYRVWMQLKLKKL